MVSTTEDVRGLSRRLRDLAEPIAACVYFVPEALDGYKALGLPDYGSAYFCSRSACLGHPSPEVVTAAFGVFNPAVVRPAVEHGWSKTDPSSVLRAREDGATAALRRMLGRVDVTPAVEVLRPVMESLDLAGRALYSGLRAQPFPGDQFGQLWRVCDYVRERRGDGHIAAWIAAGCDPVEIGLLTELFWGLELATYIRTRGWSDDQIDAGIARLETKGYIRDRALTDDGLEYRRTIEEATDAMDADVVDALGSQAPGLFDLLEPWTNAVIEAKGYPVNPKQMMSRDTGSR